MNLLPLPLYIVARRQFGKLSRIGGERDRLNNRQFVVVLIVKRHILIVKAYRKRRYSLVLPFRKKNVIFVTNNSAHRARVLLNWME